MLMHEILLTTSPAYLQSFIKDHHFAAQPIHVVQEKGFMLVEPCYDVVTEGACNQSLKRERGLYVLYDSGERLMSYPLEKVESISLINKEFSKEIRINTSLLEASDIYDLLPRVETTRHLPSIHGLNDTGTSETHSSAISYFYKVGTSLGSVTTLLGIGFLLWKRALTI